MHLYIIRHGECLGQVDKEFYSDADSPLTTLGQEQAQKTANYFSSKKLDYIYSSPLVRALETATPLAMQAELSINVLTELREGFSNYHKGSTLQELQANFPQAQFPNDITEDGWEHGNDEYVDWQPRCERILEVLQSYPQDSRIALFTHGGLGNYLLHSILGLTYEKPLWFELTNCSITKIRFVPDPKAERPDWPLYPPIDVEIHAVNETTHLK